MSKAILLLGLVMLCQGNIAAIPKSLFSNNYSGMKEFIEGLLDGYYNRQVEVPESCLDENGQSKLDEDVVAILKSFLSLNPEKFVDDLIILEGDLAAVVDDCGLQEIVGNFQEYIAKHGRLGFITNFLWHIYDIEADTLECLDHILQQEWYNAGDKFGEMINYIVPAQSSTPLAITPNDITYLCQGLLNGLSSDPSNPGKCYNTLQDNLQSFAAVIQGFINYANGDKRALEQLYLDLIALYNSLIGTDLSVCDFAELLKKIERLNLDQLLVNYMRNAININASLAALQKCAPDYNACGEDVGQLIRMIIGWSID